MTPHVPAAAAAALTALVVLWNAVSGSNGGGNLTAALIASRSLTPLGAALLVLASVLAGPWLFGTAVARTVVLSVADLPSLGPAVLVAAVVASTVTLALTWWWAMPTSTTLSLVGGLAGAAWAAGGPGAVLWGGVGRVVAGMLLAAGAGFGAGWAAGVGLHALLRRAGTEARRWLRGFVLGTSALQGLGYGANDAEKAMGLLALAAFWHDPAGGRLAVPAWAVAAAGLSFGLGMAGGGWRVARTVGFRLFRVRLADALGAQGAAAGTVIAAALLGLPVSTGQTAAAALIGSGAARRLSLPDWGVARRLAAAWVVTLPLSLALGGAFVYLGRWV
jgi:PiT family inorganic phosphate transporter